MSNGSIIPCNECRFCLVKASGPSCLHTQAEQSIPDYFTGVMTPQRMSMTSMRTLGPCGPAATLFEAWPAGQGLEARREGV